MQADVQRILDVYRRSGYYAVQVDAQIIQLDNDRVNLAFVIQEGQETKVRTLPSSVTAPFGLAAP